MADILSDEHKPLKKLPESNVISDEESEEEEKNVLLSNESSKHSDMSSSASVHDSDSKPMDLSHSSFLLGRVAIFLYAFVSILISSNFPTETESTIHATWVGWFKFFIVINIIACIIGMCGAYLYKPKYVFICWVSLFVSICLTGLILIAYIFNADEGVEIEVTNRCQEWMTDDTFKTHYTLDQCMDKMRTQLLWTVVGLYTIYAIAGGFGIHIIKHTEQHIAQYLKQHPENSDESPGSVSAFSDLSHDHEENPWGYDIPLDDIEHKKKK